MKKLYLLGTGLAATLSLLALPAHAVGTAAGTDITNQADVSYSLDGGTTTINDTSNQITFEVDRKIDLTVDEVDGTYRLVVNGDANEYLTFTVTNDGNSTQDFRLSTAVAADPFGGADDYDETVSIFVDVNNDGVYDPAVDTETYIESLGADLSKTVFIVANPVTGTTDQISAHTLTATAAQVIDASGVFVPTAGLDPDATETGGAESATFVDTVFTDSATDGTLARDGADADIDAFKVVEAQLTVTKVATVISDPTGATNLTTPAAKAIPGAFVRYVITIVNNTPDDATTVSFSDDLNTNTHYAANSLLIDPDGTGLVAHNDDDATDGTGVTGTAGTNEAVVHTFPTIVSGDTAKVQFNVEIQ